MVERSKRFRASCGWVDGCVSGWGFRWVGIWVSVLVEGVRAGGWMVGSVGASADPEGEQGSGPPPWKITSYMGFYRE